MPKYEGLIAAPFTPMHPDGSLRLDGIADQARRLVDAGVRGAFVCGTTGEGLSLTSSERRDVAAAWRAECPAEFAVIVHVGHAAQGEAISLTEHAGGIGADAVAAMPSSPFASADLDGLVDATAEIAAAAPSTPFFYYHVPSVSGIRVSMHDYLDRAKDRIPNLAGVKFTFEDLMDYSRCVHMEGGRFDLLFGRDEIYLAGLACGAKAAVGSTYNFAAPLFHAIGEAFARGDLDHARRLQYGMQNLIAVLPDIRSQKHAVRRLGQELGPVRAPLRPLTRHEADDLDRALDAASFEDVCAGRVVADLA